MKKIKVLAIYRGNIFETRGTPIRVFNILSRLQKDPVINLSVFSWDKKAEIFQKHLKMNNCHIEDIRKIISYVRKNKIDIVIGYTSSFLYYLWLVKFFTKCKIGFEIHGFMEEEARAYQNMNILKYLGMKIFFGFSYWLCDFITTSEGPSTTKILQKYNENILTLSGGVNLADFNPNAISGGFIKKDSLIVIGYAGNARVWQGVDFLVEAYRKLLKQTKDFKLVMLLSENKDFGPDIQIVKQLPNSDAPKFLVDCDILVIPRPDIPATHIGYPSKLSEYLAMGKALVVSRVGDMDKFVTHGVSGLIYEPGNMNEFIKNIICLRDENLRKNLGTEAIRVAQNLSWESIVKRLVDYFKEKV